MDDELPWVRYSKAKLHGGMGYPVGRDRVEMALRAAETRIHDLYFWLPPKLDPPIVITATWLGTGGTRIHNPRASDSAPRAGMQVMAVPNEDRAAIREKLEMGGLDRVCQWIAELTADGGDASLIAPQQLALMWSGTELAESNH